MKIMKQKTISSNRALLINMVSGVVAFGSNVVINFFLSPYIIRNLGIEANGFITLANSFISYASLATIAINSMSGIFITMRVYQKDMEGANRFYTVVALGNFFLALIMIIPSFLIVMYLDYIINIPTNLVWDVKILFALIFVNFIISTAFSSWGTATFVTNKLYYESIRNMQSQLLRVLIIIGMFVLFQPSITYMGVASFVSTIYVILSSLYYKRMLMPELRIRRKDFDPSYLKELIGSGIWNTILKAGQILLSGFDLLIANLFIGSPEMGMLALAKTLPTVITQFAGTLTSVFVPTLTIKYANGDLDGVKQELKKSMKITGVILTIPLSVLIVFGNDFYKLWVPSQDAGVLQILSVLTCFGLIFTSGIFSLYNVFTVVNKLKTYSLLILISGIASAIVVFILLHTTSLGIYAVAGVSSFINLIRNMFYTVPFGAKYLKLKWNTFIPEVAYSALSVAVSVFIGYSVKNLFVSNTWGMLTISTGIASILGFIMNVIIVLNKNERSLLINTLLKKLKIKINRKRGYRNMNQIIINDVIINGYRLECNYTISGDWKQYYKIEESFFVEYSKKIEDVPKNIAIIPLLCNILPIAWIFDAEIVLDELDKDFYDSIKDFKKGYIDMYPQIDFSGKLSVTNIVDNFRENISASVVLFSGGVDAHQTLFSHIDERPTLATLWGSDIMLDDIEGWRNVERHLMKTAKEYCLDYVVIKSSFRTIIQEQALTKYVTKFVKDDWWHGFQHGLGLLGHMAPYAHQYQIKTVYIASSYTALDKGMVTCASDPTIDDMLKFNNCHVVHDGYEYTRQDKIQNISNYVRTARKELQLRVCWESTGGTNCCHCEKCYRTILGIIAEKENPRNYGFNYSDDEFKLMMSDMRKRIHLHYSLYNYIQEKMRINYSVHQVDKNLKWFYKIHIDQKFSTPRELHLQAKEFNKRLVMGIKRRVVKRMWRTHRLS